MSRVNGLYLTILIFYVIINYSYFLYFTLYSKIHKQSDLTLFNADMSLIYTLILREYKLLSISYYS
jgi:hypothetical protein